MKKRPMTPETKAFIEERANRPQGSLLSLNDPLKILRVDFSIREISVITGLSLRTLSRHNSNYSFKSTSHKVLTSFAMDYLANVAKNPQLDSPWVRQLHAQCKEWYDDKTHNARG